MYDSRILAVTPRMGGHQRFSAPEFRRSQNSEFREAFIRTLVALLKIRSCSTCHPALEGSNKLNNLEAPLALRKLGFAVGYRTEDCSGGLSFISCGVQPPDVERAEVP